VGGELLEQRIGRLHRIGQEHEVSIHVPYLPGSAQEMLFRFHHQGLDAFENCLPGAPAFEDLGSRLQELARSHLEEVTAERQPELPAELEPFLEETRSVKERVLSELAAGRDRLLELGSFRRGSAETLAAEIQRWDEDPALESFVVDALDYLGVDVERISPRTFVFRQGSKLEISSLPGLRAQEVGMTGDRARATREGELDFLTWDHPMVTGVLDLVLGGPMGSASVALLPRSGSDRSILLEAMFVLEAVAPPELDLPRFLPPTPIRIVVDRSRADRTGRFPVSALEGRLKDGRKEPRLRQAASLEDLVPGMVEAARALAEAEIAGRIEASLAEMRQVLSAEIARLASLAEVNDHLDRREVTAAKARMAKTAEAIGRARLRLDSLRLLWVGVEPSGG
jgi:ATP-dependent helicase HepA